MSSKMKSPITNGGDELTLIPKLRFSAFQAAAAWKIEKVDKLVDTVTPPKKLPTSQYASKGEFPIVDQSQADICGWTDDHGALVQADLPLIIFGDHTCVLKLVERPFAQGADGIKILKPRPKVETQYLYQFLIHRPVVTEEYKRHYSILKEKLVPYPDPKTGEQHKIASCLDSVDALIAAQGRKVAALRAHKKGLMQQLFPQEGETQPRLRFLEFRDAGEWDVKTVGDVSNVLMCKRIFAEETNPHIGVPFFKIGTLGGVPDAFIAREKFEEYKSRYKFPRQDEILITCSGTVGKCLPYDGKEAYFQDSNIVWLDNPKGEVTNEFLFILLSGVNWGRLNSTTITRLYGPDLRGLKIKFPGVGAEQQRIADCVASLDDFIAAETRKLDTLKTHKKGLMQQLFPSVGKDEA
jgi:type I restriction enzyme S subunit